MEVSEWFSRSQAEHLKTYDKIVNALTPKGLSPIKELGSENLGKLVEKVIENFTKEEIQEWAQKELDGAKIGLKDYGQGEIGKNYKMVTWASGFYTYPIEYKSLFSMVLDKKEMNEAEKLFFFYKEESELRKIWQSHA